MKKDVSLSTLFSLWREETDPEIKAKIGMKIIERWRNEKFVNGIDLLDVLQYMAEKGVDIKEHLDALLDKEKQDESFYFFKYCYFFMDKIKILEGYEKKISDAFIKLGKKRIEKWKQDGNEFRLREMFEDSALPLTLRKLARKSYFEVIEKAVEEAIKDERLSALRYYSMFSRVPKRIKEKTSRALQELGERLKNSIL